MEKQQTNTAPLNICEKGNNNVTNNPRLPFWGLETNHAATDCMMTSINGYLCMAKEQEILLV